MLSSENRIPAELREAVNLYLAKRLTASVISTGIASQAARASVSGCAGVPDQEFADYIAERAIEAGFAVSFDEREPSR